MLSISIEPGIKDACPDLKLLCIQAEVQVVVEQQALWQEIDLNCHQLTDQYQLEDIAQIQSIKYSRLGYKALGKDPSRYRLSAEALLRRVVNGKGLYKICNLVDLLNLISIQTGYSIGGYDLDKIQGGIRLSRGQKGAPYEAIGRGQLNIENLPVVKDELGAFGSPTSDSQRTMVQAETKNFLMIFFHFGQAEDFDHLLTLSSNLLNRYAQAANIQHQIII